MDKTTEQEGHKAEVLVGARWYECGMPHILSDPVRQNTYTLLIAGKLETTCRGGRPDEIADEFATILKKHGISEYTIVDGERLRCTNEEKQKGDRKSVV